MTQEFTPDLNIRTYSVCFLQDHLIICTFMLIVTNNGRRRFSEAPNFAGWKNKRYWILRFQIEKVIFDIHALTVAPNLLPFSSFHPFLQIKQSITIGHLYITQFTKNWFSHVEGRATEHHSCLERASNWYKEQNETQKTHQGKQAGTYLGTRLCSTVYKQKS